MEDDGENGSRKLVVHLQTKMVLITSVSEILQTMRVQVNACLLVANIVEL